MTVKPFFNAVSEAEGDMRKVYDLALILNFVLEEPGPVPADLRAALTWLTTDLVDLGKRLKEKCDHLYETAKADRAA